MKRARGRHTENNDELGQDVKFTGGLVWSRLQVATTVSTGQDK
jgi:hypothetical protein